MATIYTLGFAGKSAEKFFGLLQGHGIRRVLDIRLRNTSNLAGFTKRDHLEFFLRRIGRIRYEHEPLLAPTDEMLDGYRGRKISWDEYEARYRALLEERQAGKKLKRKPFEKPTALLCTEPGPEKCHRRIAAEYLAALWPDVKVVHL